MQHLDLLSEHPYETLATYLYEISETLETYACNMRFQAQRLLAAWTKWRLVDVELDATE
jgi:hypothetical protein